MSRSVYGFELFLVSVSSFVGLVTFELQSNVENHVPLNTPKSNIIFLKLFNKLNTETMNRYIGFLALALTTSLFSSCSLIEGIFKAGMWWGIILVIGAVVLVIWLISKLFGGRGGTN